MNNRRPYGILIATIFTLLLLWFLYSVAEILLLLFLAVLFAQYLGAITEALQKRIGLPRPLGILAALVITGIGVTALVMIIVPPLVAQTQELIGQLPILVNRWNSQLAELAARSDLAQLILPKLEQGETFLGGALRQVTGAVREAVPIVFSGFAFLIEVVSVLVMGIFLALRPTMYREGFIALAPPIHRELVRDILADLGRTLRAWIVGQLLAMFVLGALTWFGLVLLHVNYALAFGVFTGVVAIVPFFGTLVSTMLPALFVLAGPGFDAWISVGPFNHALLVVLLGVVVHLVEANIVAPMIMERQVHLPPVLSILSVLIMAHLLQVIGLLVAVPVLASTMVITKRVYIHRVLEGKGFRRAVRDKPIEIRLPSDGAVLVNPAGLEASIPTLLER